MKNVMKDYLANWVLLDALRIVPISVTFRVTFSVVVGSLQVAFEHARMRKDEKI